MKESPYYALLKLNLFSEMNDDSSFFSPFGNLRLDRGPPSSE